MEVEKILNSSLDDLIFENRNKDYGAYDLRKIYNRNVNRAVSIAALVFLLGVCYPYIKALLTPDIDNTQDSRLLDPNKLAAPPPLDNTTPPPPPPDLPPPPPKTVKFTPPVIKPDEEVKPDEQVQKQDELQKTDISVTTNDNPDANIDYSQVQNNNQVIDNKPKIFTYVEKMPSFPGGEKELVTYLSKNLHYPVAARENGIEGKVAIQFVVNEDGSITDVTVKRDIGGGCGDEAARVVRNMPKWNPGKQNGNAVKVQYTLPVTFKLGDQ